MEFVKLGIYAFTTLLFLLVGCDPIQMNPTTQEPGVAVLQVAPAAKLEDVQNDVRVRIFVERFLRDECLVVEKSYEIIDLYMLPNQSACRYDIEVLTTTEEVYSLSVDLHRDGSMSMPIAKFLPRGEKRSRAIDASHFVSGPLDGNLVASGFERDIFNGSSVTATADPSGQATGQSTGKSTGQSTLQVTRLPAAPSAAAPGATQTDPRANSGEASLTKQRKDPNADKLETYLGDWLQKEHKEELESFLLRGREPTTFKADRYYTQIITANDSGFEVTVDIYRNGEIRIFKARKIF